MATPTASKTADEAPADGTRTAPPDNCYELPVLHVHVPAPAVEAGFWGALAGAALLGAVDPPLAVLVGAGVVVARHHRS